ncbi:flavin reductase family protein [Geodermatophilus nigrescens]|uniref:flavin reductase family protein n=1 Tax=Geodermatophilaceae TaxID=85030 RepID=UPI0008846D22|nr:MULTISPECIES: flavin reductase family protein [Geodermatophilaceae]RBY94472.1 flavin reductase [Blastococcus sp. TBT05-19]SDO16845.1 NADH-FMN oxidoreductase RutF, flavin reductase (DIM6/NTAB) family [Geodermatophilus sp. DSM 45219]
MLDPRTIRNAFGRFATGVTVVTCAKDDGLPHGATVNAFTAVSLEPALCQVTLTRQSKACGYLEDAPFAVNVLSSAQLDTAWHFAGRPQSPEPEWAEGPTAPVLVGNAATISCRPWRTYDGGDHLIVIGEVADLQVADEEPLVFFSGRFRELAAPATGIHWAGSMDCPELGWFDASTTFTPLHSHEHRAAS